MWGRILGSNALTGLSVYFITKKRYEKNENLNLQCHSIKNDAASKTFKTYTKIVSNTFDSDTINVYENEKKWLLNLHDSSVFPKLLYFNDNLRMIVTIDEGELLTKCNIPYDYNNQGNNLIKELKRNNCRHNDIKPTELVIKEGKIKLIDFGWAHEYDKENPESWPECLGDKYKCTPYNDKCSLKKTLEYIVNK